MENLVPQRIFTLGEMLGGESKVLGDIEIRNECNDTLAILWAVDTYVAPLTSVLRQELLDRSVLRFGVIQGRTVFILNGVDDAE